MTLLTTLGIQLRAPLVGALDWLPAFPGRPDNRVGPVNLGRDVRIEWIDRDTTELVMNACQPRGHYFFPIPNPGPIYSMVRTMPLIEREKHAYRWDPDGVLRDALTMGRLIRDNGFSTQYAARITDFEGDQQQIMYVPNSQDAIIDCMRPEREYLTGGEAEELANLLDAYWQIGDDMPGRVTRAIGRMTYVLCVPT